MDVILSKLEEAIITKNENNEISVTNQRGDKIIKMITTYELQKVVDQNKKEIIGLENSSTKQMTDKVTDKTVLESKIFCALNDQKD